MQIEPITAVPAQRRAASMLTALTLAFVGMAARAEAATNAPGLGATLAVNGDGVAERSADIARLAVSIVTSDDNAVRSAGKNTDIYNALKARAGSLGVIASALRTTSFSVRFVPHPPKGLPPEQHEPRYGYVTARSLSIDVTPIENVGKIVDAANSVGVTDIGDVSFDLRDRKGAYREALAAAFNDAKANAAALAGAGGLQILRVRKLSSETAPIRPFGAPVMMRAAAAEAPAPTAIEPNGPIAVSAHVTVEYEIR